MMMIVVVVPDGWNSLGVGLSVNDDGVGWYVISVNTVGVGAFVRSSTGGGVGTWFDIYSSCC